MATAIWTEIEDNFSGHTIVGYEYEESITTGATGKTIPVKPKAGRELGITLIAGANTGKFQATTAPYALVLADTVPVGDWFDITLSSTTGTVTDSITSPISGIRGVSLAGTIKIQLRM